MEYYEIFEGVISVLGAASLSGSARFAVNQYLDKSANQAAPLDSDIQLARKLIFATTTTAFTRHSHDPPLSIIVRFAESAIKKYSFLGIV